MFNILQHFQNLFQSVWNICYFLWASNDVTITNYLQLFILPFSHSFTYVCELLLSLEFMDKRCDLKWYSNSVLCQRFFIDLHLFRLFIYINGSHSSPWTTTNSPSAEHSPLWMNLYYIHIDLMLFLIVM